MSLVEVCKRVGTGEGGWGGGGKTGYGTEKRCSHNLQSGHLAWWSADNCCMFPIVNILEARSEATEEIIQ